MFNHCFKVRGLVLAAVLTIEAFFAPSAFAQGYYFIVDTNNKIWASFYAYRSSVQDINDVGQVVGSDVSPYTAPASWLTGPNGEGPISWISQHWSDDAAAVNNAGQVVGTYQEVVGWVQEPYWPQIGPQHAFITGPNGMDMRNLGTLGGDGSSATDINDAGQVAGASQTISGDSHAFITGPNGVDMRDLGTLGGESSVADGINDAGQAVGWAYATDGNYHAFITGPDGMGMRDLGTLGRKYSAAVDINDEGQVVGNSNTTNRTSHAFITDPDGMGIRDLGTLGGEESWANGINDEGKVVGYSDTATGEEHAFITGPDGMGMMDLNSLVDPPDEIILNRAIAINDRGQILVYGDYPPAPPPPPIPEPETCALMLAGLGLIGFMVRRKKAENKV